MKNCEALCISMKNISGNVYHLFLQQMSMPMILNDTTVKIAIYSSKPVFLYSRVEIHTPTNIVKLC